VSSPAARGPVPVERSRALGVLGGVLAFTVGFAIAGVAVLLGHGGTPPYLVGLSIGLVGIGLVGFFYHRGAAALPEARLWSPTLLRPLAEALGLPAVPVIAVLYLFGAVGVVGNLLVPMVLRG
jgi:hypothetical protein